MLKISIYECYFHHNKKTTKWSKIEEYLHNWQLFDFIPNLVRLCLYFSMNKLHKHFIFKNKCTRNCSKINSETRKFSKLWFFWGDTCTWQFCQCSPYFIANPWFFLCFHKWRVSFFFFLLFALFYTLATKINSKRNVIYLI